MGDLDEAGSAHTTAMAGHAPLAVQGVQTVLNDLARGGGVRK